MNWKDIPGYEGLYKISDTGDILSLRTNTIRSKTFQAERFSPKRIMPYQYITLRSHIGKLKYFYVHVLVMLAFKGEKPAGKYCIKHLNDDPKDNRLINLMYDTQSQNNKDSYLRKRKVPSNYFHGKSGSKHIKSIPIIQFKDGKEFARYESMRIAEKETGLHISSICKSIKKGYKTRVGEFKILDI